MCCNPKKRAARAQRKLLRHQEREARRNGLTVSSSFPPAISSSKDTISMAEVARAIQRLEERGELPPLSTTTTAFSLDEKEVPGRPGMTNPPSYGAVMKQSACHDKEGMGLLDEKSANAVSIARQSGEHPALCAGIAAQSGCCGASCESCTCGGSGCVSRGYGYVYGGCGRRGGCRSPCVMLVRFVIRKVKENREKKVLEARMI